MFKRLLKFELGYQAKQIGFWMTCVIMFALGALTMAFPDVWGSSLAGQKIKANGAQMIAGMIASYDIAAIFFGSIFVVTGILRDKTHKMLELVHTTPVKTFDMTATRMIGIYLTVLLCLYANTAGQFIGQFNPSIDEEILGPVNPLFYLQPMLLFTAVNALIVTAFFTLIAGLTQNRMIVFVSAIALFFVTIMTGMTTELDFPKWAQAIADPFGSIAYSVETEFWPPEDRNSKLLPLFGYVGLNRLVWGAIALLVLAAVFGRFKRGLITGKTKLGNEAQIDEAIIKPYHPVLPKIGWTEKLRHILTRSRFEYNQTVRSIPFIILASLAVTLFAFLIIITVFFSPQKLIPTSLTMLNLGFGSFLIPVILIIAFFSGELIWRDRTAKFNELLDATPVNNTALLLGKWIALSCVLLTLSLLAVTIGIIIQMLAGGTPVDLGLYLRYMCFNAMPNYLALAFLALFMQSFAPNRIVGMLLAMGAMVFVTFFVSRLPFYHPLIGFSGTSPGAVSEISPYSNWIRFRWFNGYFGSLCALFAIVSIWLWRRGLQAGLLRRIRTIGQNITPISGTVAALFLAAFMGSGAYIYNAYDKVDWENSKAREKKQAAREKMLKSEAKLRLPKIQDIKVDADIYPSRQEATIGGSFALKNTYDTAITELYVTPGSNHEEDNLLLEIDGASRIREGENAEGDPIKDIEDAGQQLWVFDPPLETGAKTEMRFKSFFHSPRLADRSAISKNGTFMNNYGSFGGSPRVFPTLGARYIPMTNPDKRRKYDLPELEKRADRDDMEARQRNFFGGSADYANFEAKICTDANQIPIAPGELISENIDGDRRCRQYKANRPILSFFSMLSGDYVVTEDSWTSPDGEVLPIRVYHNKNHDYSVENMIDAVQFGLSHYSEHFAPYQYNYVRIMEVPFIGFAQAFAGTIPYSEGGFIMDAGKDDDASTLNNAAHITMHEIAHQWFAHQIVPADTRGFNVLSEGLTSYAAMDAYEARYGWDKAHFALEKSTIEPIAAFQMIDRNKEEPLALASNQQYLVYNKADWVLWSLKHYIGKDKLRGAMREFIEDYGSKGPPYPTTLELTQYLKDAAGPEFHQLIEDQWDRITYWDLAYGDGDIKVTPNESGGYIAEVPFKLDKTISTEEKPERMSVSEIDGEELNEWIEIGFYANKPKEKWSDWQALKRVRVTESESVLRFDLDDLPAHIALDPRRLLQEKNITDNVKAVPKLTASN